MSHIPESLRKEGYTSEEETPAKIPSSSTIPDYLNCPICKGKHRSCADLDLHYLELFIQPEMFSCGHTVCKMCLERSQCPVCKKYDTRPPMTNYVLAQMIEAQYPQKIKQRQQELDEISNLRKKVQNYVLSARFDMLSKAFDAYIATQRYASSQDVMNHLQAIKELKSPLKEPEMKYFVSVKLQEPFIVTVGGYIVKLTDMGNFLDWVQLQNSTASTKRGKKKTTVDHTKMLPILLLCYSRSVGSPISDATYQKIAQVYNIDIGKALPLEEWRSQPSYWIKEVELGDVKQPAERIVCSCGRVHAATDSSDEEADFDSEEEEDF
jgi:hypothetical protein